MVNSTETEEIDDEELEEKIKAAASDTHVESVVEPKEEIPVEPAKEVDVTQETNEDDVPEDLPDNTDGYSEADAFEEQLPPFSVDYKSVFEKEVARTNTKKSDVLKVLNIESFDDVDKVSTELLESTLAKLKSRKTYAKK